VVVEVMGFGCDLCGLGFAVTVAVVLGVVVVVAVLRGCEDEPQAAITKAIANAASDAVAMRRKFFILVRRTPRQAITSRPPRATATNYSRPVHFAELTAPEQRVLGCLIEKRWTTPEQYPLSLNALRLACNQSTNRDPVVDYDEPTVRDAVGRLSRYGLARLASGHGSRATKYRHLAEEALGLGREELAVLAVLLLRGPQTPGELKARTERMAQLPTLDHVERVLRQLIDRRYAIRLERRPGQKEERFAHRLGEGEPAPADPGADGDLPARVASLEAEVAALRSELSALRTGGATQP
jgi:uncharacterized protein YceH (UPF0502 family)